MRYIYIADIDTAEEIDDAIYLVKLRLTEEEDPKTATLEPLSEGDIFKIKKRAPEGADALMFHEGNWFYFNSKTGQDMGQALQ